MPSTIKEGEVVLTVGISPDLRKRVRLAALAEDRTFKEALAEALTEWLRKHEQRPLRKRRGGR